MRTSISTLLTVLALTFGAGTAFAQNALTATPSSVPLTYAKGSATPTSGTTTITSGSIDATSYTAISADTWLVSTPGTNLANTSGTGGDTLTLSVNTSVADHMAAGIYTSVVPIVGGSANSSVTVSLTITASLSPLTSTSVSLTYILGGLANQSGAKVIATISSNDTAFDIYAVTSGVPTWLTVTPAASKAKVSTNDSLTFAVVQSFANSLMAGTVTAPVHLTVAGQPDLVITVSLTTVVAQPLTTAATSLAFTFVKGGTTPALQTAAVKVASGTLAFTLDASTVPLWLTVAPSSGTANSTSGQAVTFTPVGSVISGLSAGNYTGAVGFLAAGAASELTIPVVLTVSNTAASLSISQTPSIISSIYNPGVTVPTPVVTVVSSDEPTSFSATCAVATTNPTYVPVPTTCMLSGASTAAVTVSGVAYTFGTPLTTTFDPLLFGAGTPFGTVITLTVTVTGGSGSAVTQTYKYTVQPVDPTFTALSPTSANEITGGTSLVVTLTGTNFVSPGSILATSSLSPTKVFVGATDVTALSVVYSPTLIVVSIPQADFPALVGAAKTINMVLGVANQTGNSAPTVAKVTQTLVVTTAPVIYAVTSTATYNQPLPGGKPIVAPYEIVSIFGANFGATANDNGTLDAFSKFLTTVNVSGLGTTLSPYVTLSVTFKSGATSYSAPILFADATQVNCIVPSLLPLGAATVTVTTGTTSSDGLFPVTVVVADPGIFTLSSQGGGQGAILNQDSSVNKVGNEEIAGNIVSIYMTGLGAPNSTGIDNAANAGGYPAGCVQISNTTALTPGYLQVVNKTTTAPVYTAPATAWTSIDGAVINPARLLGAAYPPCFTNVAATVVSVTFGSGGSAVTQTGAGEVTWAGFAGGSVAGLYQVNVKIPAGLAPSGPTTVPVMVTLGTEGHSPATVVTMAVK